MGCVLHCHSCKVLILSSAQLAPVPTPCPARRDGALAVRGQLPQRLLLARGGPRALLHQLPARGGAQGGKRGYRYTVIMICLHPFRCAPLSTPQHPCSPLDLFNIMCPGVFKWSAACHCPGVVRRACQRRRAVRRRHAGRGAAPVRRGPPAAAPPGHAHVPGGAAEEGRARAQVGA